MVIRMVSFQREKLLGIFVFPEKETMSKKGLFKQLIADSTLRPLDQVISRDIVIHTNVPKVISLVGLRRAGKTFVLYDLIRTLRRTVPAECLVYLNYQCAPSVYAAGWFSRTGVYTRIASPENHPGIPGFDNLPGSYRAVFAKESAVD